MPEPHQMYIDNYAVVVHALLISWMDRPHQILHDETNLIVWST